MTNTLPMSTTIHYIVEERLLDMPARVNFAWCLDTKEEAQTLLLSNVETYGEGRLYTAFISVDKDVSDRATESRVLAKARTAGLF